MKIKFIEYLFGAMELTKCWIVCFPFENYCDASKGIIKFKLTSAQQWIDLDYQNIK